MKKLLALLLSLCFIFAACSAPQTEMSPDKLIEELNVLLSEAKHGTINWKYECFNYDDVDIYVIPDEAGVNTVLVHDKVDGEYYISYCNYTNINEIGLEDEYIYIISDGMVFSPDSIFQNFSIKIIFDYKNNEIVSNHQYSDSGIFGVKEYSSSETKFDLCSFEDSAAYFKFGSESRAGAQIYVEYSDYEYEADKNLALGFKNTANNIDSSFIKALSEHDAIINVEVSYLDEHIFAGTQIYITYDPAYKIDCFFNKSGNISQFEDFNFEISKLS